MTAGTPRSRRGRAWDEAAIRGELTAFVAGRTTWPTYQEFITGGAKGLRDALGRLGGVSFWAHEMGLADSQLPRGGVTRWTEETITAELTKFLIGRDSWPTRIEFEKAGLRGLSEVLREREEAPMWAERMGVEPPRQIRKPVKRRPRRYVQPPDRAAKPWPRWTEQTIASALSEFLAGRDEWPKHSEFVDAGRKGLYHAILQHGGSRVWAARMDVRWVDRKGGQRSPKWTEEHVRAELSLFLNDCGVWPTAREFAAAGQKELLRAARRLGGTDRWMREFSLPPDGSAAGRPRPRLPTQPRWTDQRIEAAIGPLVETLGGWPTKSEFRHAGLSPALSASMAMGAARDGSSISAWSHTALRGGFPTGRAGPRNGSTTSSES